MFNIQVNKKPVTVRVFHAATGKKLSLQEKPEPEVASEKDLKSVVQKYYKVPKDSQVLLLRGGGALGDNCAEQLEALHEALARQKENALNNANNNSAAAQQSPVSATKVNNFFSVDQQIKDSNEEDEELNGIYLFAGPGVEDEITNNEVQQLSVKQINTSGLITSVHSPQLTSLNQIASLFSDHIVILRNNNQKANERIAKVKSLVNEMRVQQEALKVLVSNLSGHRNVMLTRLSTFKDLFGKEVDKFQKVLQHFNNDIAQLKSKKIHDKIAAITPNKTHLIHFFDEEKLRNAAQKCTKDLQTLLEKTQLNKMIQLVQTHNLSVRDIEESFVKSISFQKVNSTLEQMKRQTYQDNAILESFEQDYESVLTAIKQNDNYLEKAIDISKQHEKTIQDKTKQEQLEKELIEKLTQAKLNAVNIVKKTVTDVSNIHKTLKKVKDEVYETSEIMKIYRERFWYLERLHCIPAAYSISLLEVRRRNLYRQRFNSLISQIKEKLDIMRDDEVNKRKTFYRNAGKYIPPELIPGIDEEPPQHHIQLIRGNSTNLPEIMDTNVQDANFVACLRELLEKSSNSAMEEELKLLYLAPDENSFDLFSAQKSVMVSNNELAYFKQQMALDLQDAKQKLDDLQQSKSNIEKQYVSATSELASLQKQLAEATANVEEHAKKESTLEKELSDARIQLLNARKVTLQFDDAAQENVRLAQELASLKLQLQDDKVKYSKDLQAANNELQHAREVATHLTKQLEDNRVALDDMTKQKSNVEIALNDNKSKLVNSETLTKELFKKIDELNQKQVKVETELAKVKQSETGCRQTLEGVNIKLREAEHKHSALQKEFTNSSQQLKQSQQKTEALEKDKASLLKEKEQLSTTKSALETQLKALEADLAKLKLDLSRVYEEGKRKQEEVTKILSGQKQSTEANLLEAESKIQTLQNQLKDATVLINTKDKLLRSNDVELNALRKELKEFEQQHANAANLKELIQQLSQQNESLRAQNKELLDSAQQSFASQAQLNDDKKHLTLQIEQLRLSVQPILNESERRRAELESARQQSEQTQLQLAETQKMLKHYKIEFSQLTNQYKYLQSSEQQAQQQIKQYLNRISNMEKLILENHRELNICKQENDTAAKTIQAQFDAIYNIVEAVAIIPSCLENYELHEKLMNLREKAAQVPAVIQGELVQFVVNKAMK